jgi:hypothetical protein
MCGGTCAGAGVGEANGIGGGGGGVEVISVTPTLSAGRRHFVRPVAFPDRPAAFAGTAQRVTFAVAERGIFVPNGLTRKIWQKIILIQRAVPGLSVPPSLEPARIPPQTVATS